jgi:mRNA interferase RelE/StbE
LNTQFKESFLKDLRAIKDRDLLARANEIIQTVEQAQTPQEIPTLKKLRGERNYFRIRIGDYRLGLKIEGQLVTLVRILNRKEIYRYFP